MKDQYNGLFKPLSIFFYPWTNVILDFIIGLPINNGYNVMLMVVHCLTKEKYYILYTMDENGITIKTTTQLLL